MRGSAVRPCRARVCIRSHSLSMHPFFRSLPFAFLSVSAFAQTNSNSTGADEHESVIKLDNVIVSAGPGDRTAFDLAQNTSILTSEELHERSQGTLGETLAATPGINSTYYGPG